MDMFNDEELTIRLCKFGGPLILFIIIPAYLIIIYLTWKKDLAVDNEITVRACIEISVIFLLNLWFGIWMCRKGYGWFGGDKS